MRSFKDVECVMKKLVVVAAALASLIPNVSSARDPGHQSRDSFEWRDGGEGNQSRGNARPYELRFAADNDRRRELRRNERRATGLAYDEGRNFGRESFGFNRGFGYHRERDFDRRFGYRGRYFTAVRAPVFAYPRGWAYRRWAVGAYLPLFFIASPYIVDWEWIGLPPPPPGYEWVRYGPDALLVNRFTGPVLDVVYGVFY